MKAIITLMMFVAATFAATAQSNTQDKELSKKREKTDGGTHRQRVKR